MLCTSAKGGRRDKNTRRLSVLAGVSPCLLPDQRMRKADELQVSGSGVESGGSRRVIVLDDGG